jgi:heme-degrading monooxygenase HmoA
MMLRIPADPAKLEAYTQENPEQVIAITDHAKQHGVLHHRFLAGDGEVVVLDEWETKEGFLAFFESDEEIPKLMQAVGAGQPAAPVFFESLETPDEF